MSDSKTQDQPDSNMPALPNCPLCHATTVLAPMHKAVAAVANVFRCTACGVLYPVTKKDGEGV